MNLEEGAAPRAARLAERRRRRRLAERQRRAQLRRRNVLACAAVAAFAFGIARGAGYEAGPVEASAPNEESPEVTMVDDFHDPVPILMYHGISPPPAGTAYPELFVPEAEFESQMEWLAGERYHGVTLDEVFAAWNEGESIAENPVVVSFDDGLRSQYVGARPVLDKLGWPAVLNLKVESIDQGEMTEPMVEDLIAAGWEIDSHTISHRDVTELSGEDLRTEVGDSRSELTERFGEPVDFFAYPAGAHDAEAIAAVEEAGYLGAVTTEPGLASPDEPFELRRIRVEGGAGAEGLEAKLADTATSE